MTTPLILATGFSVFPGAPENPTSWAMAELEREGWRPEGAHLVTRTLPVRFDMWERELRPLLAAAKPNAVIAFGLSAKTTGITLESTARNRVALERPDISGACATAACVADDGDDALPSRLPLREMAERLKAADIPIVWSDDAGDYLCNLLFYRLVEHAGAGGPAVAGFVHVPYLDTQIARLAAAGGAPAHGATLSESQLVQGVKIVIECCAAAVRRPRAAIV